MRMRYFSILAQHPEAETQVLNQFLSQQKIIKLEPKKNTEFADSAAQFLSVCGGAYQPCDEP